MKRLLLLSSIAALLLTACAKNEPQAAKLDAKTQYELKQTAQKAIQKVAGKMQMTLYKKAKEGGITNAATFCSTNASALAKKASTMLPQGVKLKRITDKPRNSMNMANEEELQVLNELKEKLKNGEKVDMLIKQKSENHFQVYKPLRVMGACLKCHGTEKTRNPKAYEIIADKYPNDKAVDYKLYDFRGAFLVDIIK